MLLNLKPLLLYALDTMRTSVPGATASRSKNETGPSRDWEEPLGVNTHVAGLD